MWTASSGCWRRARDKRHSCLRNSGDFLTRPWNVATRCICARRHALRAECAGAARIRLARFRRRRSLRGRDDVDRRRKRLAARLPGVLIRAHARARIRRLRIRDADLGGVQSSRGRRRQPLPSIQCILGRDRRGSRSPKSRRPPSQARFIGRAFSHACRRSTGLTGRIDWHWRLRRIFKRAASSQRSEPVRARYCRQPASDGPYRRAEFQYWCRLATASTSCSRVWTR